MVVFCNTCYYCNGYYLNNHKLSGDKNGECQSRKFIEARIGCSNIVIKESTMKKEEIKIVVIGAGAIGGITAAFLKKSGYDVFLVCKSPELAKQIESQGLHISGVKGDFFEKLSAFPEINQTKEKFDIALIATKATDMGKAAQDLLPFLKKDSIVVSMQNGICEEELSKIVGMERTIGCVVGWGATMHKPGELEMTSTGVFILGYLDDHTDEKIQFLKDTFQNILPTEISNNIYGHLYSKLIINSCITTVGAICGLTLGKMLFNKKIRRICIEVMHEAVRVASALKIHIKPYANRLNYYDFLENTGTIANFKRHTFLRLFGWKYKKLKSSSLQSLERGKKTEIDYLNGYISRKGKETGIHTPLNDKLIQFVKEIESKERKIGLSNFNDPFFKSIN